jgi:hypothetical protein
LRDETQLKSFLLGAKQNARFYETLRAASTLAMPHCAPRSTMTPELVQSGPDDRKARAIAAIKIKSRRAA